MLNIHKIIKQQNKQFSDAQTIVINFSDGSSISHDIDTSSIEQLNNVIDFDADPVKLSASEFTKLIGLPDYMTRRIAKILREMYCLESRKSNGKLVYDIPIDHQHLIDNRDKLPIRIKKTLTL